LSTRIETKIIKNAITGKQFDIKNYNISTRVLSQVRVRMSASALVIKLHAPEQVPIIY